MNEILAYGGLFLSAFGAATVLPIQSEIVFVGMQAADYVPWLLVLVAGVGNTLGAVVNWFLGTWIERFRDRPWFPAKQKALDRAQHWYHRYGKWSLLMSWAPFIGDPLTIVAGLMRERLLDFVIIVTVAKFGRYIFLALVTEGLIQL